MKGVIHITNVHEYSGEYKSGSENAIDLRTIKVKCMIDSKAFSQKPTAADTKGIQHRIKTSDVEIQLHELATQISKGCTFKPAWLCGSKSRDWIQQQLFALDFNNDVIYYNDKGKPVRIDDMNDFDKNDLSLEPKEISLKYGLTFKDNRTTIDEQLKRCEELNIYPAFGYTSFSHTESKHKFRFVFCNDEVVKDPLHRCKLQYTLINIFDKSDMVTFDATRLFYGGRDLIYDGYCLINGNEIVDKYYSSDYEVKVYRAASNIRPEVAEYKSFLKVGRKGVLDNNYIKNKSYIVPPKPPKPPNDRNIVSKNITALRKRDSEYLKRMLNYPKIKVDNNAQYMDYICKIDLAELLEIDNPTSFNCLFHNDKSPSASIYIHQSGHYLYKCHSASCGKCYNILNIVEKLGGFESRQKAHKFIREIFNIEFEETQFQKEQKALLMDNIIFLTNGEYRQQCPTAYSNTSWSIEFLVKLLELAMHNVKDENLTDKEGLVAFFASASYLCKEFHISSNSMNKVFKKIAQLTYHNLINKLDDEEIPDKMNERRKAISANSVNKKINVFSIPSYVTDKIEEIEQQGIKWKENKYTMKGISREMFYRAEGKDVADRIYPQCKKVAENGKIVDRTTSAVSNERTLNIVKVIFRYIEAKGYVTEKDIIYDLSNIYRYITTEEQIKRSLKEILDLYGLRRMRTNKELKEQYKIDSKGYPFIITRDLAFVS